MILTVKDILLSHQGTLAEVHDQGLADYQKEKSVELARTKAEDLAKLVQGGQPFDKAAKSLGLDVKTSDAFARNGSVPDVGTGQQLEAAFSMPVGQEASKANPIGANWLVYRVAEHDARTKTILLSRPKIFSNSCCNPSRRQPSPHFEPPLKIG